MAANILKGLVAYVLQSMIVLAAAGAAQLPLARAVQWLAHHAQVGMVRHEFNASLEHPGWFASGVWVLAQLCLSVHTVRALRHGRGDLSGEALFTPLLIVLYVGCGLLVVVAMVTFVSNSARVFLGASAALWCALVSAALLGVWLLQLGWAEVPRGPGARRF